MEPITDAIPLLGAEHRAYGEGRTAPPRLARSVNAPAAIHSEMAAQRVAIGEPEQHVLAAGNHLGDRVAGQVQGGQFRNAEFPPNKLFPGQCPVHPPGREPHGVTFGHVRHSFPNELEFLE